MSAIRVDNDKAFHLFRSYFDNDTRELAKDMALVVVQHIVPNTLPLVDVLSECFQKIVLIPKPKSVNAALLQSIEERRNSNIVVVGADRESTSLLSYFQKAIEPLLAKLDFIIMDIGGYFAASYFDICATSNGRLKGVIEDTENGHQKYLEYMQLLEIEEQTLPILSVARSPLKEPEDFLVGRAIVYSVERILRDNNSLVTNKRALVIGYGKIGKSVASALAARDVTVWIFDTDPIRRAQALSHGYFTPSKSYALPRVDLVISATGSKSLTFNAGKENCDFSVLKPNCFVASVTSADDEFLLGDMSKRLKSRDNNGLETFKREDGSTFYLLHKGNAVNFAHNNTLGPYIYIVASELIYCLIRLLHFQEGAGVTSQIIQLQDTERRDVAERWLRAFLEGGQDQVNE